ncbi:MAG TPA: hypothetical protein VF476_13590 [Chitinophagaceae bacterium]
MRKFLSAFLLLVTVNVNSQDLGQVTFSGGANFSHFGFLTDRDLLIRISDDGKIMEWGIEVMSNRYNYYAPKLQPYLGRVDYYGPEADSISRGKIKSIGTCVFTYYGPYEMDYKVGKLRTVGTMILDYYSNFDNAALKGKLRFIGNLQIDYYSSFENEAYRGKLRAIGSTPITYYSSFDDKLIRGKVKSIGPVNYSWYTSLDKIGYGGGLKAGNFRQPISGVTYILQ